MNTDRIKELHQNTAYPESKSVYEALLQLWNECEQEYNKKTQLVSVKERLPETNNLCICYTEYGYSFRYWKGNHFEGEHVANEPKVTYWMYAPIPPTTTAS